MKKTTIPSRSQFAELRQICNLIPQHLVPKLARESGLDKKARTFSPWSHLVSLNYAQLTHAIGLNDICDGLRLHNGQLVTLGGANPPSRNNLSHSNKERDAMLAEKIFWSVLGYLQTLQPGFARGNRGKGVARRFRRVIHVVDSTTINWSPPAWTGLNIADAKLPPSVICGLIFTVFRPDSPSLIPHGKMTVNDHVNYAPVFVPVRLSFSTRRIWISPISLISSSAASFGSPVPTRTWRIW
jgi:hypothetical protein